MIDDWMEVLHPPQPSTVARVDRCLFFDFPFACSCTHASLFSPPCLFLLHVDALLPRLCCHRRTFSIPSPHISHHRPAQSSVGAWSAPPNRVWLEVHLPLSVVVLQGWRGQPVFQLVATDSRIHRVQRHTALRPDVAWTDPQLHRVRRKIWAPGPPSAPYMYQLLAPTAPKMPTWSLSSMGTGSSSLRPPPPLPP